MLDAASSVGVRSNDTPGGHGTLSTLMEAYVQSIQVSENSPNAVRLSTISKCRYRPFPLA